LPAPLHILGAGLAGTFLARALLRRGRTPTVWDDPAFPSASRAAIGLVNPVTGIRLAKTWNWDAFAPAAFAAFDELARESGSPCWRPLPIDRIFRTPEEAERAATAQADPARSAFLAPLPPGPVSAPHGGFRILGGGWFSTAILPRALPPGIIRPLRADPGRLEGTVIDCRGWPGAADLPLPWNPAKGETLTLHIPQWPEDRILLRGIFTVPLGGGLFRAGATYEWNDLDPRPTEAGRRSILQGLEAMGAAPGEIVDHRAGIRPILRGSRPVAGPHPTRPGHWVLNGLGSKGALMAPLLAEELAAAILGAPAS
jgi:glycine/D-amino acid oxidase-like deaminating enzyme